LLALLAVAPEHAEALRYRDDLTSRNPRVKEIDVRGLYRVSSDAPLPIAGGQCFYPDQTGSGTCHFDFATGKDRDLVRGEHGPIGLIGGSPSGRSLLYGTAKDVVLLDLATGRRRLLATNRRGVTAFAFAADEARVAIASSAARTIRVIDLTTDQEVRA